MGRKPSVFEIRQKPGEVTAHILGPATVLIQAAITYAETMEADDDYGLEVAIPALLKAVRQYKCVRKRLQEMRED